MGLFVCACTSLRCDCGFSSPSVGLSIITVGWVEQYKGLSGGPLLAQPEHPFYASARLMGYMGGGGGRGEGETYFALLHVPAVSTRQPPLPP